MGEFLLDSFNAARGRLLDYVKGLDETVTEVQPQGFNNTIHWHVGHVLTVAEQFMFGYPARSNHLPERYMKLFAKGTKPADWQEDIPSVQELLLQLNDQLRRIQEIPPESFDKKLKSPLLGLESFGGIAGLALFHEGLHLGKIQEMNRIIKQLQAK